MPDLKKQPPIVMLVAISAVGPLTLNIFMPSMPGLPAYFDTDYGTVQLTLSLYLAGLAIAQLVYGPLSDRFGRRPLLLSGFGLFLIGTAAGYFSVGIEMLIASRVLQAIGGCAGIVLTRAIVRDLFDRERSASVIGYVSAAMVMAPMVGPLIGGYLDQWAGWQSIFVFVGAFTALVTVFAALNLHESNHDLQPLPGLRGMFTAYRGLLALPVFRGYAFLTAFASAGFFAFLGGAPYVVVELMGRPPSEYGWYFALSALGYMTGNLISGRMSVRMGVDRMVGLGLGCNLIGATLILILWASGPNVPLVLFGPMILFAVGNGLTLPNGTAGAVSANPRRAGAASGLSGFLQMSLGAGASALAGHLVTDSQFPVALMMIATSVVGFVFYLRILATNRREAAKALPVTAPAG